MAPLSSAPDTDRGDPEAVTRSRPAATVFFILPSETSDRIPPERSAE